MRELFSQLTEETKHSDIWWECGDCGHKFIRKPSEPGAPAECAKCGGGNIEKEEIAEETTSGDIAYAPGVIKPASPEVKAFVKDDSEEKNKKAEARLEKIKEAMDAKVPRLRVGIVKEVNKIINRTYLSIEEFHTAFTNAKDITPATVMIKAYRYPDDVAALEGRLPEDVGELELMMSSLREQSSLGQFDAFSAYEQLYGAKLGAKPLGNYSGSIILASFIDITYKPNETLMVEDPDTLDYIKDQSGVKTSGKFVYPVGGVFRRGFFEQLKTWIDSEESDNETI